MSFKINNVIIEIIIGIIIFMMSDDTVCVNYCSVCICVLYYIVSAVSSTCVGEREGGHADIERDRRGGREGEEGLL